MIPEEGVFAPGDRVILHNDYGVLNTDFEGITGTVTDEGPRSISGWVDVRLDDPPRGYYKQDVLVYAVNPQALRHCYDEVTDEELAEVYKSLGVTVKSEED